MKFITQRLHCGDILLTQLDRDIRELDSVLEAQPWAPELEVPTKCGILKHQSAYNYSISSSLARLGWNPQPRLCDSPRLIGDFAKGLIFGEVQFGNSATLYRDFYKFQYGLSNGLLSLAVLIVPNDEKKFFPTRAKSVSNMANYSLALRYLTVLSISVPTIIYGLMADGE